MNYPVPANETERVEAAPVKEEDSSLLDQLTGNKPEQVETEKAEPEEKEDVETDEEVNRALLDGLAGADDDNKSDESQEADDA